MLGTKEEIIEAANADIDDIFINFLDEGIDYSSTPGDLAALYLRKSDGHSINQRDKIFIRDLIYNNHAKKNLFIDSDPALVNIIIETLHESCPFEYLQVILRDLDHSKLKDLGEAISDKHTLNFLCIRLDIINNNSAIALSELINNAQHLKILDLDLNSFTSEGMNIFSETLKTNNTLTTLLFGNLSALPYHPLINALRENTSITVLGYHLNGLPSNDKNEINSILDRNKEIDSIFNGNKEIRFTTKAAYDKAKNIFYKGKDETFDTASCSSNTSYLTSKEVHNLLQHKSFIELLCKHNHINSNNFIHEIENYTIKNYLYFKEVCNEININENRAPYTATLPLEILYKIFSYNIYSLKEDLLAARISSQKHQPAIDVPEGKEEIEDNTLATQEGHNIIGDHSELN
ncbi:MAG: hypothetical protein K0Q51_859 [Rickettsiaceae bacterium]|jgi:hypothetical protein|nr:hypothetical protein [Rickettsiaceae bacterium]